jgi:hypothetical protein
LASAQILGDIRNLDCHGGLECTCFNFRPRDSLLNIAKRFEAGHVLTIRKRRAFAPERRARDKHSYGVLPFIIGK